MDAKHYGKQCIYKIFNSFTNDTSVHKSLDKADMCPARHHPLERKIAKYRSLNIATGQFRFQKSIVYRFQHTLQVKICASYIEIAQVDSRSSSSKEASKFHIMAAL